MKNKIIALGMLCVAAGAGFWAFNARSGRLHTMDNSPLKDYMMVEQTNYHDLEAIITAGGITPVNAADGGRLGLNALHRAAMVFAHVPSPQEMFTGEWNANPVTAGRTRIVRPEMQQFLDNRLAVIEYLVTNATTKKFTRADGTVAVPAGTAGLSLNLKNARDGQGLLPFDYVAPYIGQYPRDVRADLMRLLQ